MPHTQMAEYLIRRYGKDGALERAVAHRDHALFESQRSDQAAYWAAVMMEIGK